MIFIPIAITIILFLVAHIFNLKNDLYETTGSWVDGITGLFPIITFLVASVLSLIGWLIYAILT